MEIQQTNFTSQPATRSTSESDLISDKPRGSAMNARRRRQLEKVEALLSQARGILEEVASDERKVCDDMPDSVRDSEWGERMEEVAEMLSTAVDGIEALETTLTECRE